MLDTEFKYYKDHQGELVSQYEGKFIVIKDEAVIGVYETQLDAYNSTVQEHQLGTFLIQHVMPGKDSYTETFYSRVILK